MIAAHIVGTWVMGTGSLDIIYDFYGLAFCLFGAAVAVRAAPLPGSVTKRRILALAAFGLIHGVYEWLHLSEFAVQAWNTPTARHFVSVVSFLCLGYFAAGGRGRYSLAAAALAAVALSFWGAVAALATDPVTVELATRWGFAAPVSITAGFTLLSDKSLRGEKVDVELFSQISALVFFIYAGFQLFTAPADFFPASVFNTDNFEAVAGVSVLIARGLCAVALTLSILLLLNSFDGAIRNASSSAAERFEAELKANRKVLQAVFDLAPVGLLITRLSDGSIVRANTAFWMIIGYEESDRPRLSLRKLTPERHHMADEEARAELLETGRFGPFEKEYRRRDGSAAPVQIAGAVLESPGQEPLIVSVVQDVSEQKATESRLRRQQRLAEQANVAKSQFMANMSHELRTPLNGVLGMLELINRQPLEDKVERYCDIALNSGYALLRLVEDLLNFETLSSGAFTLEPADFAAERLMEIAVAPLETEAARKGLRLQRQCLATGQFHGDAKRIGQVISNILGNAIKFTDEGEVSIRITDRSEGSGLHIVIRDTGIGMSDALMDRAFERFTQGDASATRPHQGAGLGLSIAKGIVDAMGGAITLNSQEGQGTTVKIDLPLPVAETSGVETDPEPETEAPAPAPAARRSRILIAEDNDMNRSTIEAMLDDARFELIFAASGTEALELASKQVFDLMILDIQMPGCSGDEVLRAVRQAQKGGDNTPTPAIACTAHAYDSQRESYQAAGFDSVVTKPIDLSKLEAEVARLLAA